MKVIVTEHYFILVIEYWQYIFIFGHNYSTIKTAFLPDMKYQHENIKILDNDIYIYNHWKQT